ncbi:hypothetical protein JKP88DRAFT_217428 [Tribonema minus]|uniref:Uncharacterized protein n=1 Tax=Tribonema minus TaxID=303371 RepID=A0A836CNY0_9STRA|nr:hypothetical protein JKP88DRAFT_217428 [Tribonema minus]
MRFEAQYSPAATAIVYANLVLAVVGGIGTCVMVWRTGEGVVRHVKRAGSKWWRLWSTSGARRGSSTERSSLEPTDGDAVDPGPAYATRRAPADGSRGFRSRGASASMRTPTRARRPSVRTPTELVTPVAGAERGSVLQAAALAPMDSPPHIV